MAGAWEQNWGRFTEMIYWESADILMFNNQTHKTLRTSDKFDLSRFDRIKLISREKALEKVVKVEKKNPILAITYDPRLMSISHIVNKHYKAAAQNFKFQHTFPNKPMVAYRKQKTIGDNLIRAKLHPPQRVGIR